MRKSIIERVDCVNEKRDLGRPWRNVPSPLPLVVEDEHKRIGGENSRGRSPGEWSVAEAG